MRIEGAFAQILNLETSLDDLYELFMKKTNAITKIVGHEKPRFLDGMNPEVAELYEKRRRSRLNFVKKTTSLEYR